MFGTVVLVSFHFTEVKDDKDMSNYENIPDSTELPPAVPASADPFVDWQLGLEFKGPFNNFKIRGSENFRLDQLS